MVILSTVLSGVLVFVLGQVVVRLVLDPVAEFKRHVGDIAHSLVFYANRLANPPVPADEAAELRQHFRRLAAVLQARYHVLPKWGARRIGRLLGLPSADAVHKAAGLLVGLSNSVSDAAPREPQRCSWWMQEVADHLGIYVPPNQRISRPEGV